MVDYVSSDDIVGMFAYLVGERLHFDFPRACRFFCDENKNFPDVFDYVFDESRSYPYSKTAEAGLNRVFLYFSSGESFGDDVRRIEESCGVIFKKEVFNDEKLGKLEEIAGRFKEEFSI